MSMIESDSQRSVNPDRPIVTETTVVAEPARSSSAGWLVAILVIVAIVVAAFALGFIDIDQTKTAQLPDVKVETSGGQAPAFDVDTADINVGTKTETIEVPTVTMDKAETGDQPAK
jgi:hypothetical protein